LRHAIVAGGVSQGTYKEARHRWYGGLAADILLVAPVGEPTLKQRQVSNFEERARAISDALVAREDARLRVLELSRRGRITLDEADAELEFIGSEAAELRRQLEVLQGERNNSAVLESRFAEAEYLLSHLADELQDIERMQDHGARRFIVERLVRQIAVRTLPSEKRIRRPYTLRLRLACGKPRVADRRLDMRRNVVVSRNRTTMSNGYIFTYGSSVTFGPDDLILQLPLTLEA